ncbi:hypothetical protein SynA1524_01487 [Synechococcus sp. A15-24]|nr:hypothetical protein SynA1524_01487 [Synechococcus sp. A15-24]
MALKNFKHGSLLWLMSGLLRQNNTTNQEHEYPSMCSVSAPEPARQEL